MIDFVSINGKAFPLINDADFITAKAAMRAADIEELTIFRAHTANIEKFVPCDVIETGWLLVASSVFIEVALFDVGGQFYVGDTRDFGQTYHTEASAIEAIAEGYQGYSRICEDDLPLPLNNDHCTDLRLYRLEGTAGPSYAGIAHYIL